MNVKSEIAKRIGVAVTLGGLWFQYNAISKVLVITGIVILLISCIGLGFRRRLSQSRWWKKLVTLSEFDITFAALALTMFLAGTSLRNSGVKAVSSTAIIAGCLIILAGGFFFGGALGQSISQFIAKLYQRRAQKQLIGKYIGSIESNNYHYSTCSIVKRILPQNLISFHSVADAQFKGYKPCGICKAPFNK